MKVELTKAETSYLSSSSYVSLTMKQPDTDEDHHASRIRILKARNCDHVANVCIACAEHWEWDYHIHYQRTVGGRKLKAELDALNF